MEKKEKYIFGPVPSRRLGLSLGVDIVPRKVCTLDCVYCQVGRSTEITTVRKIFVPVESVISELKTRLDAGVSADFITISGSGEPTLHIELGKLIAEIRKITKIPIAVLTNGTLLYDKSVREDCAKADVVLPSLDAGDEDTFKKINRPNPDITIEKLVCGLCEFRKEYKGQIWLEVFFIEGINTGDEQIANIKKVIEKIKPDKVQLNTAVRPTADQGVSKVKREKLELIASKLGPNSEVIADFSVRAGKKEGQTVTKFAVEQEETLFSVLKRRPCSIEDICSGLKWDRGDVVKYLNILIKKNFIESEDISGVTYFKAK